VASEASLPTRRARRIGAAVLVVLTVAVAGLQWLRGRQHAGDAMTRAFDLLAEAETCQGPQRRAKVVEAQERFARASAVVQVEPMALIGVAVTERLADQWAAPAPAAVALQPVGLPPTSGSGPSDEVLANGLRGLLEQGRVDEAMHWAEQPLVARRTGAVRTLLRFAAAWQQARLARGLAGTRRATGPL
jgi:hypothetical protein